jgi:hypothetical protein
MQPLPIPEHDGAISLLWNVLAINDPQTRRLILGWLLQTFNPNGPYPLLVLEGVHGSSKSFTSKVLRSIIDPSSAMIRAIPKDEKDLIIACVNGWVVAIDNISSLGNWLSDALCRVATGSGFSTRTLYTDEEETIFAAARPIILNGISQIATRHDLLDRALIINLESIPEDIRKTEKNLNAELDRIRPKVLGGLLNAVCQAMERQDSIVIKKLPRMADFAIWASAGERALGIEEGGFLKAYNQNRTAVIDLALEEDAVSSSIIALLETQEKWSGECSDLLEILSETITDNLRKPKGWPQTSAALGKRLTRATPFLQTKGIIIDRSRTGSNRKITLRKDVELTVTPVTSITSFEKPTQHQKFKDESNVTDQLTVEAKINPSCHGYSHPSLMSQNDAKRHFNDTHDISDACDSNGSNCPLTTYHRRVRPVDTTMSRGD